MDPKKLIQKVVGEGKDTRFWFDWWMGEDRLQKLFQRIFNSDTNKQCTVEEGINKYMGGEDDIERNRRAGRTMEDFDRLKRSIGNVQLNSKKDKWVCVENSKGVLTVNWFRKDTTKKGVVR